MANNQSQDAISIAQMLYTDLVKRSSVGELIDLTNVMDCASEYIKTLNASCSPCDVLSFMEHQAMIARRQREYKLLEHPSMYE